MANDCYCKGCGCVLVMDEEQELGMCYECQALEEEQEVT